MYLYIAETLYFREYSMQSLISSSETFWLYMYSTTPLDQGSSCTIIYLNEFDTVLILSSDLEADHSQEISLHLFLCHVMSGVGQQTK